MMVRAAEAMREAAARKAESDVERVRRNGHYEAANSIELRAAWIRAIDVYALVDGMAGAAADRAELDAFDSAAKSAKFSTTRRDSGELFYPITQRAFQVWQAAVRWCANQQEQ